MANLSISHQFCSTECRETKYWSGKVSFFLPHTRSNSAVASANCWNQPETEIEKKLVENRSPIPANSTATHHIHTSNCSHDKTCGRMPIACFISLMSLALFFKAFWLYVWSVLSLWLSAYLYLLMVHLNPDSFFSMLPVLFLTFSHIPLSSLSCHHTASCWRPHRRLLWPSDDIVT